MSKGVLFFQVAKSSSSTARFWTRVWATPGSTSHLLTAFLSLSFLFPLITISFLWASYLLRCLKRTCIVSWYGFGNCLIRSLTAGTRCLGSCSEKGLTTRDFTGNWKQLHILDLIFGNTQWHLVVTF